MVMELQAFKNKTTEKKSINNQHFDRFFLSLLTYDIYLSIQFNRIKITPFTA